MCKIPGDRFNSVQSLPKRLGLLTEFELDPRDFSIFFLADELFIDRRYFSDM